MTDFKKIAKSIVVHFAHICAYGVETVKHSSNINSNGINNNDDDDDDDDDDGKIMI